MKRRDVRFSIYLALGTLGAALAVFALAGCGGNSGPIPGAVGSGNTGGTSSGGTGGNGIVLAALLPDGQTGATRVGKETCGGCHGPGKATEDDVDKLTTFNETMHAKNGIECEDCHGPGSNHVNAAPENRKTTILGLPNIAKPEVCGQCHGAVTKAALPALDQYDQWSASKHFEIVEREAFRPGCNLCHFDLARVIVGEEGGVDPTEEEVTALHTVSCAVCHDPHGKGADEPQLRHPTTKPYDAALIGPTVSSNAVLASFDHVCAECHNGRGIDGSDAGLNKNTSRADVHHSNQFNMLVGQGGSEVGAAPTKRATAHMSIERQCVHCHMGAGAGNHTMLAGNQGCTPCHAPSEAASLRSSAQSEIQGKVLSLQARLNAWGEGANLDDMGEASWEYGSEGGPSSASQKVIPIEVKRARHNYAYVVEDKSMGIHNIAYTRYLLDNANAQLDSINAPKASPVLNRAALLAQREDQRQLAVGTER
ncbi:MAG: hypothetical protein COZ06_33630 [Armatimonadetes bacterium CG_4_10_14_3_um_filter_66_18]|nr:hypothetical protein [Armatimonadota bacterium]OIP09782.1 MAG: hypothetical protein AUJ96_04690 [Armatimonadetes bacterium CG2_30_66_41]PIY37045.1 MAG: hypothetical protein COZ06_33630 [Armatimonadetes bacterium CG_4_10_14_3_um_filter_66_18]PIZ47284.1 MAG: hypothetical protein COY42_08920 [Armatimonadetes bacterium CG_4_10_14_0_8_um_filter_66_14]PJB61846.1 MAG: hypothetical protein CO096_27210 [Armatimonadetes bacterium CG_4_9_14_3_um_filter_66_14]